MTMMLRKGCYVARFAQSDADVIAAQRLRHMCFVVGAGRDPLPEGLDRDRFDTDCLHVLVEDAGGRLLACFRLLHLAEAAQIGRSYAAQYYDLTALQAFPGPVVEMGRFCVHPDLRDPDVLRVAWGAVTRFVDSAGTGLLFGCSSFAGTQSEIYADSFAQLRARHLAPARWNPATKARDVVHFSKQSHDPKRALQQMPPLLRTYLGMGGWVSDHAVVDRAMNTLHVFTGVEIAAIPAARARALRAVAG